MKVVPDEIFNPTPGCALVCGSKLYETRTDRRTLYPSVIGIDMIDGEGVDYVADLTDPAILPLIDGAFTHVDCVSMLEHCAQPFRAAEHIERALVAGGTLLVSAPWVWRLHSYPSDLWRFTPNGIRTLFPNIEFTFLRVWSQGEWHDKSPVQKSNPPMFFRSEVVGWGVKR